MPFNEFAQEPWIFSTASVIWIMFSACALVILAESDPEERRWTRSLIVRLLLVIGGPVTIVVGVVGFLIIGLLQEIRVVLLFKVPKTLHSFFRKSPPRTTT